MFSSLRNSSLVHGLSSIPSLPTFSSSSILPLPLFSHTSIYSGQTSLQPPPPSSTNTNNKPPDTNLWIARLGKMQKWAGKQKLLETQRREVYSRETVTMKKNTASTFSAGDSRLRAVRKTLDNVGVIRSSDQILFHNSFIAACLPKSNKEKYRITQKNQHFLSLKFSCFFFRVLLSCASLQIRLE